MRQTKLSAVPSSHLPSARLCPSTWRKGAGCDDHLGHAEHSDSDRAGANGCDQVRVKRPADPVVFLLSTPLDTLQAMVALLLLEMAHTVPRLPI